jgi:hypothetical protein
MLSFNKKTRRINVNKNSFKKYPIKRVYTNVNTLKNSLDNNIFKSVNCSEVSSKNITDCKGNVRISYCKGKAFRRPLAGYRKVGNTDGPGSGACTIKLQEIYKDPYALSMRTSSCYDKRIRSINNKNGVINRDYNYDYGQYLRNKGKAFNTINNSVHVSGNDYKTKSYSNICSTDTKANGFPVVNKDRNKKFSSNSAVSSGSRLARLKYDTVLMSQKNNCKNGELCGVYTPNVRYQTFQGKQTRVDHDVAKKCVEKGGNCKMMRIGGVMRKAR